MQPNKFMTYIYVSKCVYVFECVTNVQVCTCHVSFYCIQHHVICQHKLESERKARKKKRKKGNKIQQNKLNK